MLRSFQGFRAQNSIYFYEDEVQVSCNKIVLCKESLDRLIGTIEQNNYIEIKKAIELFYQEMGNMGMNSETMTLNVNYLLFRLIHLASEQDDDVNQQEILPPVSRGHGYLPSTVLQTDLPAHGQWKAHIPEIHKNLLCPYMPDIPYDRYAVINFLTLPMSA